MRITLYLLFFFLLSSCFRGEELNDERIENILSEYSDKTKMVLENAADLELQVLYTEIDRRHESGLRLITHGFGVDPNRYFYPAGSVRLFAAALALERINELNLPGLNRNSILEISDSLKTFSGQGELKLPFDIIISNMLHNGDNVQFDQLYDFLGQQYINEKLWSKGFNRTRILNRLSVDLSENENRATNAFHLFNGKDTVYSAASRYNPVLLNAPLGNISFGEAHYRDDKVVDEPMSFRYRNFSPLIELHHALIYLLFPEVVPVEKRFNISEDDRNYLIGLALERTMNDSVSTDDPLKTKAVCFMAIDSIFGEKTSYKRTGVSGQALGFMVENGYWVDEKTAVEFIFSAVVLVNKNRIFNDGKYKYRQMGVPVLKAIITAINKCEKEKSATNGNDVVKP